MNVDTQEKKTLKNSFRASYSVLSTWAAGDWNRAIEMYFKLSDYDTPAMRAGRAFHERWQKEIDETKCLPKIFGGKKLNNPITEQKIEKRLNEWLDLVGVIDCMEDGEDGLVLYDWKTGKTKVSASTWQFKVYQILLPDAKRAEIHHYDQYKKQVNVSIAHLTPITLYDGVEWVLTHSSEMYSYLLNNNLFEKLGDKLLVYTEDKK